MGQISNKHGALVNWSKGTSIYMSDPVKVQIVDQIQYNKIIHQCFEK